MLKYISTLKCEILKNFTQKKNRHPWHHMIGNTPKGNKFKIIKHANFCCLAWKRGAHTCSSSTTTSQTNHIKCKPEMNAVVLLVCYVGITHWAIESIYQIVLYGTSNIAPIEYSLKVRFHVLSLENRSRRLSAGKVMNSIGKEVEW